MLSRSQTLDTAVMVFSVLTFGFAISMVSLLPPGPVTMTLVGVGVSQGRSVGVRSGAGAAAGDTSAAIAAGLLVASGAALPDGVFSAIELFAAALLILVGTTMAIRPGGIARFAGSVTRPTRTFFALAAFTPTVFAAWVAIMSALPFDTTNANLASFLVGAFFASAVYHVTVGTAAGTVGPRLTDQFVATMTRASGCVFGALGLYVLLS